MINIPTSFTDYFNEWKRLREQVQPDSYSELEIFYLGFVLGTNTILKEKFLAELHEQKLLVNNFPHRERRTF